MTDYFCIANFRGAGGLEIGVSVTVKNAADEEAACEALRVECLRRNSGYTDYLVVESFTALEV